MVQNNSIKFDNLRLFIPGKGRHSIISITKKSFSFYEGFITQNELQEKRFVELYFDAKSKVVGFQFSDSKAKGRYKISSINTIYNLSFLTNNGIDSKDVQGKYIPTKTKLNGEEIFLIQLK